MELTSGSAPIVKVVILILRQDSVVKAIRYVETRLQLGKALFNPLSLLVHSYRLRHIPLVSFLVLAYRSRFSIRL